MALLKKKSEDVAPNVAGQNPNPAQESQATPRPVVNRPHIDKKIDDYAVANPKYVDYLNGLSKERLVRMLLLVDLNSEEAQQNRNRGFHQFALTNPALAEAVREIRETVSPEQQAEHIARLGKAFAIGTNTRVAPVRAPVVSQSGPKAAQ